MKKVLAVLGFLLALTNVAFAQSIVYYGIENTISDSIVNTSVEITLAFPNVNTITIPIFANSLYDFSYNQSFPVSCRVETKTYGADIICDISKINQTSRTLIFNYATTGLVSGSGDQFVYRNDIYMPLDVDRLFYEVALPEGMGISKNESLLLPSGWNTNTDGRKIFVFWNKDKLTKGSTFSPKIVYESIQILPFVYQSQYLIIALVGILFIGFVLWRRRTTLQIVMPVLKSDEKKIFEAIMKYGTGVHQKLIVKESNYSKAKVSKVLKSLEERGLIRLERIGRHNRVHIVEKFGNIPFKPSGNNQKAQKPSV